jgi:hypothetical protein
MQLPRELPFPRAPGVALKSFLQKVVAKAPLNGSIEPFCPRM